MPIPKVQINAGLEGIQPPLLDEIEAELTKAQRRRIISEVSGQDPAKQDVADSMMHCCCRTPG